ncbi:MAG: hypothetical protein ACK5F0_00045 [Flavobacteriales bacterium]
MSPLSTRTASHRIRRRYEAAMAEACGLAPHTASPLASEAAMAEACGLAPHTASPLASEAQVATLASSQTHPSSHPIG